MDDFDQAVQFLNGQQTRGDVEDELLEHGAAREETQGKRLGSDSDVARSTTGRRGDARPGGGHEMPQGLADAHHTVQANIPSKKVIV